MKWLAGFLGTAYLAESIVGPVLVLFGLVLIYLPFLILGMWIFSREVDPLVALGWLICTPVVVAIAIHAASVPGVVSRIVSLGLIALCVASFLVVNAHANFGYGDGPVVSTANGPGKELDYSYIGRFDEADVVAASDIVEVKIPPVTMHYKVQYQIDCSRSQVPIYFEVRSQDMGAPIRVKGDQRIQYTGFGDYRWLPRERPATALYVTSSCDWHIKVLNAGDLPDWAAND